jgi:hypothetical protein
MTVVTMTLRLDGERPLLMNSSAKADPLNPVKIELDRLTGKRDKTVADYEQIAKVEWHAGLWLQDGKPCIPSEAIESAFNAAARTRRKGKQAKAGFCCFVSSLLEYEGPGDLPSLWADKAFVFRAPVTVNRSKVMRTRPRFNNWGVTRERGVYSELAEPQRGAGVLRDRGFSRRSRRLASEVRQVLRQGDQLAMVGAAWRGVAR